MLRPFALHWDVTFLPPNTLETGHVHRRFNLLQVFTNYSQAVIWHPSFGRRGASAHFCLYFGAALF